jgi:hypothetical protein
MAFGTVPQGTEVVLKVGTSTADTLVGACTTWDYTGDRQTTERDYYNGFDSTTTTGPAKRSMQLQGDYAVNDDGQAILKAAFDAGTTIYASVAPNGTDGESLPVRVSQYKAGGSNPNSPATFSVTLNQAADPAAVGGGL